MNIVNKREQQFSALKNGDTFILDGVLYLKIDDTGAIDLSVERCPRHTISQGEMVTLVRCTITIEA